MIRLKGKQKENLLNCQSTVHLSRTLVTINSDVPTPLTADDLEKKHIDTLILEPIFKELELFSLSKRLIDTDREEETKAEKLTDVKVNYTDRTKEPETLLSKLENAEEFVLHTVFVAGNIYNSLPSRICFSTETHQVDYITLPSDPQQAKALLSTFRQIFEAPDKTLISADVKDDLIWLKRAGIQVLNRIFDVKIAHYVLHPDLSHDLSRIALQYLNYQISEDQKENKQLTLSFDEEPEEERDFAEKADVLFS